MNPFNTFPKELLEIIYLHAQNRELNNTCRLWRGIGSSVHVRSKLLLILYELTSSSGDAQTYGKFRQKLDHPDWGTWADNIEYDYHDRDNATRTERREHHAKYLLLATDQGFTPKVVSHIIENLPLPGPPNISGMLIDLIMKAGHWEVFRDTLNGMLTADQASIVMNDAARHGQYDIVRAMLEHPHLPTGDALVHAADHGREDMVLQMLKTADASEGGIQKVFAAPLRRRPQSYSEDGAQDSGPITAGVVEDRTRSPYNPFDRYDRAAAIRAARAGHTPVLRALHRFGVNLRAYDHLAFCYACENGHVDAARYLYTTCGVDVNARNGYALHWACLRGNSEIVRMLVEECEGLDVDANGSVAIKAAFGMGRWGVVRILAGKSEVCRTYLETACEKYG
ncbi:ankyrin repeat-containing domain protein [Fimicolochytrium jonesii]|uniref:ankyrin repeat-containing domain protein n=1 Tax=Fimicolochytrium jonesii TaxID=1396493 RepID=UPI0022FE321B|nr:ankyrin repeat-containing domain protein [Fimicolochytrium jonesii]KAI8819681.1 ankyrin repeat-containing domain protein [Fimicolochytrium jonesii]